MQSDTELGTRLLEWLNKTRESAMGRGRSPRELLLDDVFHYSMMEQTTDSIAEEVGKLYKQVMEE